MQIDGGPAQPYGIGAKSRDRREFMAVGHTARNTWNPIVARDGLDEQAAKAWRNYRALIDEAFDRRWGVFWAWVTDSEYWESLD